ncbi:MAG: type VI secretion system baseplate subunit TssF [Myxococcales bacterium]|nr:type VI secretion system baseplate subunit TssF [Myxococcales bacterium]
MADHPYYREHLAFLRDGGAAMANAYPRAANRLARQGFDPDVERLLEGIAFISSKITERQAASVGDICQLLLDVLFPHYLCPIPSMATVELSSDTPSVVPRGTEIWSVPVLGTQCRFRTAMDVAVGDLRIEELKWEARGASSHLTLEMSGETWLRHGRGARARGVRSGGGRLADEQEAAFVLHLHGEPLITYSLFEWLLTALDSVELLGDRGRVIARLPARLRARGLAEQEAMLDYPGGSFEGYRVLQEYFAFPERMLYVEVAGIWQALRQQGISDRFTLRFNLNTERGGSFVVTGSNVRLGCTPVVNAFSHSADPILRDLAKIEYRVRPAGRHLHYEILRVEGVSGRTRRGATRDYSLLSELDREGGGGFAQLRRGLFDGEVQTYMRISDGGELPPDDQIILVDIVASNGQLPRALGVGDLTRLAQLGDGSPVPAALVARNITAITMPVPFPLGEVLRLRLVSHLALTQRPLTELSALRDLLDLYNYRTIVDQQSARAHQLLVDSLLEAQSEAQQRLFAGTPISGELTTLLIDESVVGSGPEAFLLGCVLDEVIALATPLNVYSETHMRRSQRGDTLRWPRRLGPERLDDAEAREWES